MDGNDGELSGFLFQPPSWASDDKPAGPKWRIMAIKNGNERKYNSNWETWDWYDEAGKVLRRALQLQPNLVYIDLKLDKYYPQPGKFAECTDALAAWVREHRVGRDAYFLLGYAEFQRGNFERAYAAFRKVARVMPKDPLTRAYLEITRPPSD